MLRVRDVMTAPVVTVAPEEDLATATRLMDEHGVTALPVVDEHGHVLGMVTETEVVRDAGEGAGTIEDTSGQRGGGHPPPAKRGGRDIRDDLRPATRSLREQVRDA